MAAHNPGRPDKYELHDGFFKRMAERGGYFSGGVAEKDKQTIRLKKKEYDVAQFFKLSLGDIGIPGDQQIYVHCVDTMSGGEGETVQKCRVVDNRLPFGN